MAEDIEARFERYCDVVVGVRAHADRREPACWYRKGLMLRGGRKSIEPMTARVIHRMCARRTKMTELTGRACRTESNHAKSASRAMACWASCSLLQTPQPCDLVCIETRIDTHYVHLLDHGLCYVKSGPKGSRW
jgi:hypothetical protein